MGATTAGDCWPIGLQRSESGVVLPTAYAVDRESNHRRLCIGSEQASPGTRPGQNPLQQIYTL